MPEIFQFNFMLRAFAAGMLIGIIGPVIGTFLVIRRYSRLADTLAHVSLAGVAIGLLTRTNPVVSTLIVSVLTALGVERMRLSKQIFGESVLALFHWSGMAIAVVLISLAKGFNVDLFSFLFGSIATVTSTDLSYIFILSVVIIFFFLAFYKELFFVSFDEELAQVNGLRAGVFNTALVVFSAVTVAVSLRVVGILLIGALMVIPVMTAMLFSRSFKQTLVFSVLISQASVIAGLFLSYYHDLASGGTIVLTALLAFLAALLFKEYLADAIGRRKHIR